MTKEYNHKEAFCIMQYKCEECGHTEFIWNSRDGVTPFGIGCQKCHGHKMNHVNFVGDTFAPLHGLMMKSGDRYFADMTIERAREYAVLRVDRMIDAGVLKPSMRNDTIRKAIESFYDEGLSPDILVKK